MLFTDEQWHTIRELIRDHHNAFIVKTIGPDAVAPDVLAHLKHKGLVAVEMSAISDAYSYGQHVADGEHPKISRMTYSTVSEVLRSNYIRAAIAHGLPRRLIFYKYALKNALIPIVTLSGQSLGYLIAGAILVEVAFSWPGIGRYAVESMVVADLSPVQAFLILVTLFSMIINLVIDISYFYLDPRIKGA